MPHHPGPLELGDELVAFLRVGVPLLGRHGNEVLEPRKPRHPENLWIGIEDLPVERGEADTGIQALHQNPETLLVRGEPDSRRCVRTASDWLSLLVPIGCHASLLVPQRGLAGLGNASDPRERVVRAHPACPFSRRSPSRRNEGY